MKQDCCWFKGLTQWNSEGRGKEKQIDKDIKQTELEVEQFHVTKQKALNEIEICVPVDISQIYPFVESGAMSRPNLTEKTEEQGNKINSSKDDVASLVAM